MSASRADHEDSEGRDRAEGVESDVAPQLRDRSAASVVTNADGRIDSPSMNDLIEAYREPGRPRYSTLKEAYEGRHGAIVEDYYGRFVHAGALLIDRGARRQSGGLRRFRVGRRRYGIALAYDSTRAEPELDETLRTVRREERQSAILLSGRAGQILAHSAYLLLVYLLSTLDRQDPDGVDESTRQRVAIAILSVRRDLKKMEQFTQTAAQRAALQYYLGGLPLGAILGSALVVAVFESRIVSMIADSVLLSACLTSGAIGAVISVMVRINRGTTLEVDFDRGRAVTILAGSFRPLIGAVFGAALFVLVQAGLLPFEVPPSADSVDPGASPAFFFIGLAFLAGFSERWAQDTIVNSAPKFPASRTTEPITDGGGNPGSDGRDGRANR